MIKGKKSKAERRGHERNKQERTTARREDHSQVSEERNSGPSAGNRAALVIWGKSQQRCKQERDKKRQGINARILHSHVSFVKANGLRFPIKRQDIGIPVFR